MASRVRKPRLFCETNSTPQRPIEPHEICVKKITASRIIANCSFVSSELSHGSYLSSVGSEASRTCPQTASRRHASLHAYKCGSYLSRSACSLFGRMLCESSTFSISHFAPLVTNRVSLFPGNLLGQIAISYRKTEPIPFGMGSVFLTGSYLSSQAASSQVLSTYKGLTTVFGMGTGGSPQPSPPDYSFLRALHPQNFHRRMNHLVLFVNHSQALDILVSVR